MVWQIIVNVIKYCQEGTLNGNELQGQTNIAYLSVEMQSHFCKKSVTTLEKM